MKKKHVYIFILSCCCLILSSCLFTQDKPQYTNLADLRGISFDLKSHDHTYYEKLKKQHDLQKLFLSNSFSSMTGKEKIQLITTWVSTRWEHSGSNDAKTNDSLLILKKASNGERFRCVEYAYVLSDTLNSFDIPARVLSLQKKNVETAKSDAGHVVNEVYIEEYKKWIIVDPQFGSMFIKNDIPLSSFELLDELYNSNKDDIMVSGITNSDDSREYLDWFKEYLYFFAIDAKHKDEAKKLYLVPLGIKNPVLFQGNHVKNRLYTNSTYFFTMAPKTNKAADNYGY